MAQQVMLIKQKQQIPKTNLINEALKELQHNPKLLKHLTDDLLKDKSIQSVNVFVKGKLVPVPRSKVLELAEAEELISPKKEVIPVNTTAVPVTPQPQITPITTVSTTQPIQTQPQVIPVAPNVTIPQKQEVLKKRPSILPQIFKTIRTRLKKRTIPKQPIEEEYQLLTPKRAFIPQEQKEVEKIIPRYQRPLLSVRLKKKPYEEDELFSFRDLSYRYAPSITDLIRQRFKSIYKPVFSDLSYTDFERNTFYRPSLAFKQKAIYKPRFSEQYYRDTDYEPSLVQITSENFAPKQKDYLTYNPQMVQEAYPTFTYATYGLPETEITQYAPEDKLKISPITEFEINAKPTPLIVNKTYLSLLGKLMGEVTK